MAEIKAFRLWQYITSPYNIVDWAFFVTHMAAWAQVTTLNPEPGLKDD